MPTVEPETISVVSAPKSVPSSLTPSQLMVRNPLFRGPGAAPLLAPPIAAAKAFSALLALEGPAPEQTSGGLPSGGVRAASATVAILTATAVGLSKEP